MEQITAKIIITLEQNEDDQISISIKGSSTTGFENLPDQMKEACSRIKMGIEEMMGLIFTDIGQVKHLS